MRGNNSFLCILIILAFICCRNVSHAQRVVVSEEISINEYEAYQILGKFEDRIAIYFDDGKEQNIVSYDDNMQLLSTNKVNLEGKKNPFIYNVARQDSSFVVIYGGRDKTGFNMFASRYSVSAKKIKTDTIYFENEDIKMKFPQSRTTEDGRFTVLYSIIEKNLLSTYVYDNEKLKLHWTGGVTIEGYNLYDDLAAVTPTRDGSICVTVIKEKTRRQDAEGAVLLIAQSEIVGYTSLFFGDNTPKIVDLVYNPYTDALILGGQYLNDVDRKTYGYLHTSIKLKDMPEVGVIRYRVFDSAFLREVYGNQLNDKKEFEFFTIRNIVPRYDGGCLLIFEEHREVKRRNGSNLGALQSRGVFMDHYDHDIVVISLFDDGKEHWKQALHKRQYATDEMYLYSSFFVFRTPSRIKFIFNDEISKSSTVSEYVLDPLGHKERHSLLNTEYQHIRLRFMEGMQIGTYQMIVPSITRNRINFVLIDYKKQV